MMNQKRWISIILLFTCFLAGCKQVDISVEEKIKAPQNNKIAIQGTYKIESFERTVTDAETNMDAEQLVGRTAVFDSSIAILGDEVCKTPEYKLRDVSAEDYIFNRYKLKPADLNIDKERIEVISITSDKKPFYDLIKIDDKRLLVSFDHGFLYLNKISDNPSDEIYKYEVSPNSKVLGSDNTNEDTLKRSCVLLGLRSSQSSSTSYRTLWIAARNREVKPVMTATQLFVPRSKDFWQIGYTNEKELDKTTYTLYAYPIVDYESENSSYKGENYLREYGERDILFVGNDYIGTEFRGSSQEAGKITPKLQVFPIDNIRNGKGINISDIAGESGYSSFIKSGEGLIGSLSKEKANLLQEKPDEDNFTLVRRNGQWVMKGRINYNSQVGAVSYEDFMVNLSVTSKPAKLINYDNLGVSWALIKERLPGTLDAYVSPNNDIAILITKNMIYVYGIESGRLSETALKSIPKREDETVVMSEWAIGQYADKWEKVILGRFDNLNVK